MIILCDSREQQCLEFDHPYIPKIERIKLDVGDYGCKFSDNYIPPVYFERKSLGDLFGTLGKGYKRFKKEIIRAKENKVLLIIIIEASLTKVINGYERSCRNGDEVCQQLFTLMVKHFIPFVCVNNREEASRFITEFYLAIGRNRLEQQKLCNKKSTAPDSSVEIKPTLEGRVEG